MKKKKLTKSKTKIAKGAARTIVKSAKRAKTPEQGAAILVVTTNPLVAKAVTSATRAAAVLATTDSIDGAVATGARVAFIDYNISGSENCYELLRRLRLSTRLRLVLLHPNAKRMDASQLALARFAGAEVVLSSPPKTTEVKALLKPRESRAFAEMLTTDSDAALSGSAEDRILRDLANPDDPALLDAICDPETRLHSSSFGAYSLDLEFKRAQRFATPLCIAIVGFDGEASSQTLLEIAAIFLNEIRDTDMLARFGVNSFLFVLPNTLANGAQGMLERISESVTERGLRDVVNDPIQLCSGIATLSFPSNGSRAELFERAYNAFEQARSASKATVVAGE
ncbi:MAG: GGDEF domain-containing protein [Planctomycetota bacterium]